MANPQKWVVDVEFPRGHFVPMTDDEYAQYQADQAASAISTAAKQSCDVNEAAISVALSARLAKIRTARAAVAAGTIFSGLNVNERAVIDGLLEDDIYVARLLLNQFDGTT